MRASDGGGGGWGEEVGDTTRKSRRTGYACDGGGALIPQDLIGMSLDYRWSGIGRD